MENAHTIPVLVLIVRKLNGCLGNERIQFVLRRTHLIASVGVRMIMIMILFL